MDIEELDREAMAPPKVPASVRDAIFGNIAALVALEQQTEKKLKVERRWDRFLLGGLTVIFALMYAGKAAEPPQIHYAVIDNYTGRIHVDIPAKDAPSYFDKKTVMGCLQEYVALRQSYIWQTAEHDFHRVAIMSEAKEQERFAEQTALAAAKAKYGMKGYLLAKEFFPPEGFTKLSTGDDDTQNWDVQFIQAERLPDQPEILRAATARLWVQFHPDLAMNWKDRNEDLCGTYVIHYTVTGGPK